MWATSPEGGGDMRGQAVAIARSTARLTGRYMPRTSHRRSAPILTTNMARRATAASQPSLPTAWEGHRTFSGMLAAEKTHLPEHKRVTEKVDAHLKRLQLVNDRALAK